MNSEEFFNEAQKEFNLGNFKKALAICQKALLVDPHHTGALLRRANILGKFGRYQEAIRNYDTVLQIQPQNMVAQINKGLALHFLQKYDEAISCFDIVLREKPQNSVATYNKASSLIRMGKLAEGLNLLEAAIKLDVSLKYKARFDVDFKEIEYNARFRHLVF